MNWLTFAAGVAVAYLLLKIVQVIRELLAPPPPEAKFSVGGVTERSLAYYNGRDWTKPLLIAIRGVVYDVTDAMDTYGPGKELNVYAGRECARAVALGSTDAADVGRSDTEDLGAEGAARLEAKLAELKAKKCQEAGKVVPMRDVTPEELAASDGSDPARPMLISIRGTVYDVTKGKDFYGPGGMYPFAGREVARAFAMLSTELKDCTDDLEGLAHIELDNLRDWEQKFNFKYPIVGTLTGKALPETVGQRSGAIPAPEPPRGPTFRSEAAKIIAQEAAAGRDATAAFGR